MKATGSATCAITSIFPSERNAIGARLKPVSRIRMQPCWSIAIMRESTMEVAMSYVQVDRLILQREHEKWLHLQDPTRKILHLRKIKRSYPVYPPSWKSTMLEGHLSARLNLKQVSGESQHGTSNKCSALLAVVNTNNVRSKEFQTMSLSVCSAA